jgi:hypothetical protein
VFGRGAATFDCGGAALGLEVAPFDDEAAVFGREAAVFDEAIVFGREGAAFDGEVAAFGA